MQKRHTDRRQYFEEQAYTCRKYYLPYIRQWMIDCIPLRILEVGCGEGGNLLPFAELGCEVVGVDMAASRIEQARRFFKERGAHGTFIASDLFQLKELECRFDILICHDVIEHISDKARFLSELRRYLSPGGIAFVAFPAWQMPFGGHQQIAPGFLSHIPFIHLLPTFAYGKLLKWCALPKDTQKELLEIKQTRCSIETFKARLRATNYQVVDERLYFINPHYEVKFGLTPRRLCRFISQLPYIRNFFSTSCFYLLKPL
ncbi:MAG: methyltransferase domain-containing protein [Bacteroides sp.]|nr:methyltransferase domain-containing protein [Bacteroides sp.]